MKKNTRNGRITSPERRTLLAWSIAGIAALRFDPALAQAWPARSVRIIVPFPPGGAADGSARVLAEAMGKPLGQPIVVENRAGAGSIVGTQAAVQSNDGHTLLMGSTSMTILPSLRSDLSYDVQRDLQPVGMVSSQPLVLCTAANSSLMSIDDVIDKGRSGDLTAGNSGVGTLSHLTTELFNLKQGTKILSIPYKGESALIPDIVSGTTAMAFLNLPSALPLLKSGQLRPIVVTSADRVAALAQTPTMKSLGMDDFVIKGWAAMFAAKDVPAIGVEHMERLLQEAIADPAVRKRFVSFGVDPEPSSRAALRDYVRNEIARWGEVVRSRGIKLN